MDRAVSFFVRRLHRRGAGRRVAFAGFGLAVVFGIVVGFSSSRATLAHDGPRHNPATIAHVLRIGDLGDVTSLNPMFVQELVESRLASMTMAWLTKYDHNNRPYPELATEIPTKANGGISPDGKTVTFHLRTGVKWSDGVPFDADDVVFTTKVIQDPKTHILTRDVWDEIAHVSEPDKFTVVYHLKAPYSPFSAIFNSASANPCIVPKHLLEHSADINTDPYNVKPVGIGPFRYTQWRRGDRIIMEANPFYFRGTPKLARVEYRIVPNRDTVMLELQTGELDLWPNAARAYFPRLQALHNLRVLRQPSLGYAHLDFNLGHPNLQDRLVRRALTLAVDRETLKSKIGHGLGIVQDGVWSSASPFFDSSIKPTKFDLAQASALLDRAGWKRSGDGIRTKNGSIELASTTGSPDIDVEIELIRGWWKSIGVDLQRRAYDPSLLFAEPQNGGILYSGKFDAALFGWYPSPIGDMSQLYGCKNRSPHGQNMLQWCDPRAESAMGTFLRSYDLAAQKRSDNVVQQRLAADTPTFVLNVSEDLFAMNSDLRGFHPNVVSSFDDMMNVDM